MSMRDHRHGAGNLLRIDVALHQLVDALQPFGGQADVLRLARRHRRHGERQCEDGHEDARARARRNTRPDERRACGFHGHSLRPLPGRERGR
jgi:hypothetical protein